MSFVWPVAILSAVFWIVCSFVVCFWDMMGDQIVHPYSRMGLVMALYVCTNVSLCLPQVVDVRALSMLIDCLALVIVCFVCVLNVCFGSKCRPRIFGLCMVGMVVFWILRFMLVLMSAGNDVNSVDVDLDELR